MNRKRDIMKQIVINELLLELHELQMQMIEAALQYSEQNEAKEVITYIMEKSRNS